MTNNDILDQLRFRRARISELMTTQSPATELLRAELNYVNAMIEFRERHDEKELIVLELVKVGAQKGQLK